jgi:hypothetical protein
MHAHAMVITVSSEAVIIIITQQGDPKIISCPIICQRVTDGWRGLEV